MARSSTIFSRRYVEVRKYRWPTLQMLFWRFVMYGAGGTLLGINAQFIVIQEQLHLGIPWLFPFGVTVGALTIIFLVILEIMLQQKSLLPGIVILGSFILLVLYITGLIESAIQLFGAGNVNNNCNTYINDAESTGVSIETLAWLEQHMICQAWDAQFAFWIIGTVFLIWLIIMATQVNSRGRR